MFEFLFKYPLSVFSKGQLVLLGSWPRWLLVLAILAAAGGLRCVFLLRAEKHFTKALQGYRTSCAVGAWIGLCWRSCCCLLWQPAISITALKAESEHHRRGGGR